MTFAFGPVLGARFDPTVTVVVVASGRLWYTVKEGLQYLIAQLPAGFAAPRTSGAIAGRPFGTRSPRFPSATRWPWLRGPSHVCSPSPCCQWPRWAASLRITSAPLHPEDYAETDIMVQPSVRRLPDSCGVRGRGTSVSARRPEDYAEKYYRGPTCSALLAEFLGALALALSIRLRLMTERKAGPL